MRAQADQMGDLDILRSMLMSMQSFDDKRGINDLCKVLEPIIIDLGRHLLLQPSQDAKFGCIVNLKQLTFQQLYQHACVTGLRPVPSLCCLQPTFWEAAGARADCANKIGTYVVMVFTCFVDYQSIFQPGMQSIAEEAMALFKACIQLALATCNGYECQEVNAVFMLTFPSPCQAIQYHLLLQQILLLADWTPEMLSLPPLQPVWDKEGQLLFRGPTVKTGIYRGIPRSVNPHSTTGRADYWGELVNRSARMMAGGKAGQLLCMNDVVQEVCSSVCCYQLLAIA
jgi:hypothetical protein